MLRLNVELTVDGQLLNLKIFPLPESQLRKFATTKKRETNVSSKVKKYIIHILSNCFFQVWHKIMMVLAQQYATPRILV